MSARIVKKTTATFNIANMLHYGIKRGEPLRFKNLVALILYTDFSELCTDFSSTFRKTTPYETLSCIKQRNREYYWMSRTIRETVERFGLESEIDDVPFYTGISIVMTIPEFRMRLCAPTSTSTQIEVAIKFSGQEGMILQLHKPSSDYLNILTAFDCSWISQYKEEEEKLFCGGQYTINIQSIRIRNTNQNFEDFIGPLLYLDAILNGSVYEAVANIHMSLKDREMLIHLMKWKLGEHLQRKCPQYIYDTFDCFCKHKKQISLNLKQLRKMNKNITDLVMNNIEKSAKVREISDKTNLFRKQMLDLFENVTNLTIVCWNQSGDIYHDRDIFHDPYSYSLSLSTLLTLIESSGIQHVVIELESMYYKYDDHNIDLLWVCGVQQQYERKGYKISTSKRERYYMVIIDKL
eukprot:416283_1